MKRLICFICLCLILPGCSSLPAHKEAFTITNTETGDIVSIGDTMDDIDSLIGTPIFSPNTSVYYYGDPSLPIGRFSAYYDHGKVCCLIVGPENNSKWEMYQGIKLGDNSEVLTNAFDTSYKDYENNDRRFAVYMFDSEYKITDKSSTASYLALFALDSNNSVISVMLATSGYLSENMDLSVFD